MIDLWKDLVFILNEQNVHNQQTNKHFPNFNSVEISTVSTISLLDCEKQNVQENVGAYIWFSNK